MMQRRTILLTGGTSGIGAEMVKLLAARNTLIVVGRSAEKLSALRQMHPDIKTYQADLAEAQAGIRLGAKITADIETLDIVIHNAAIQNDPHLTADAFRPQDIAGEVNTNLTSVIELTHALLPALSRGKSSVICSINSGLALAPKTSSAVYCATKAGLNNFSQSLSYQLEGSGIRVCQVFLPLVDTPMTEGRGRGKISAADAAREIVTGLAAGKTTVNVGKVKLLRLLLAVAPFAARRLLKAS